MKLPDIATWLASDRDFKQGVALYAALGTSATYQRLFGLVATDYSRQVLVRELTALVPESAPSPETTTGLVSMRGFRDVVRPAPLAEPPIADLVMQHTADLVMQHVFNTLLDDVAQQLRAVRDERSHLHPQLTAPNLGKKARLKHALRIVELTGQEVKLKAQEAHVRQHGRLPGPVATADVSDEAELRRRLLNLRSRRSKAKGQPEKLAILEAEIILIQSKLTS